MPGNVMQDVILIGFLTVLFTKFLALGVTRFGCTNRVKLSNYINVHSPCISTQGVNMPKNKWHICWRASNWGGPWVNQAVSFTESNPGSRWCWHDFLHPLRRWGSRLCGWSLGDNNVVGWSDDVRKESWRGKNCLRVVCKMHSGLH